MSRLFLGLYLGLLPDRVEDLAGQISEETLPLCGLLPPQVRTSFPDSRTRMLSLFKCCKLKQACCLCSVIFCHWTRTQCVKSAWMSLVLHEGFGFPEERTVLHSTASINGCSVQWSLGALLYHTRYLPLR